MLQQVHEFIKTLNEQFIKDWCVQSWSKAVRFGPQGVVRIIFKEAAYFALKLTYTAASMRIHKISLLKHLKNDKDNQKRRLILKQKYYSNEIFRRVLFILRLIWSV